ncbi:HWE histidine kinase domain-containing protein [Methylobacterium sp. B1]|uniref:HWE histidine kinase domain-containing protein n=1 Tax=Methylobacterium sp. B1 TaxID=91459 RepID=UPI00034931B4|nr:HWE histidine kinase domain-containing protein [Methylobacterium sp. B1]
MSPAWLERAALHYLERYSASTEMLRRTLARRVQKRARARGEDPALFTDLVTATVARAVSAGLVDDARFADTRLATLRRRGTGGDAAAGRDAFEARLLALSRAHDILTRESWASADLRGVATQAMRPFLGAEVPGGARSGNDLASQTSSGALPPRISLEGPDLRLPPEGALALTMILHELCTNAVKHGALSVPGGRAALVWTVEAGPDTDTLRVTWCECGGPPVVPPTRKGFGTRLLERGFAGNRTASLTYEAAGVVYRAANPLPAPGRAAAQPTPRLQAGRA